MRLYTPDGLKYPIKVTKLLRRVGDELAINTPLFIYEFKSVVEEYDEVIRDNVPRERTWPATFESELEGRIESLNVTVGQVIENRTWVAEVDEPCAHEIQFGGLCAECGMDMSHKASYNETTARAARATVNTLHSRQDLLVSEEAANKADEESKRRLLESRRLSLVVDLDQTIIHASVEPTIGEWQNDPENPNYDALQDVGKFQLDDDKPGTWYYIKPRPGTMEFLKKLSELYEMHIYTMGTRSYAMNVAKIIDPQGTIFGDRILSRTESGSMTAKNLKRLFPIDTKMVVIIDDRADVWHWIPNLVKVTVFEFFVGIGDINSSFLPKRQEPATLRPQAPKAEGPLGETEEPFDSGSSCNNSISDGASTTLIPATSATAAAAPASPLQTTAEVSAIEQMVSMAGRQDEKSIQEKTEEQEQTLKEQLDERPMLKKQQELEALAKEEEARESPTVEATTQLRDGNGKSEVPVQQEVPQHRYRHNLLAHDDTELIHLEQSLRNIHSAYYDELDRQATGTKGGRVAELRPGHSRKRCVDELEHIPDVAPIMQAMKSKVLAGVHLAFSGVIPLGKDPMLDDNVIWAKSFGAAVSDTISKSTTHVIAAPERRTAKVRQAIKRGGRIAIVSIHWLYACFVQWKKVDEDLYRIHSEASTNGTNGLPDSFEHRDYLLSSDDEATQTEGEGDSQTTHGFSNGVGLSIDTDAEDLLAYAPSMNRKDSSPIETEAADDWSAMDEEFADFMGSDMDDDSDSESVRSTSSEKSEQRSTSAGQRKRKEHDADDAEEKEGSRLQKRKKEALERTSSLTTLVLAHHPAPTTLATSADGETEVTATLPLPTGLGEGREDGGDGASDDDYDDDLEAALAAEMERQSEEEESWRNGEGNS